MTKLHKKCTYDANTRLGSLEPIVLYYRRQSPPRGFHITEVDYAQLNDGEGSCYGRTPYGPWCLLRIFRYEVIGFREITDCQKIREIEEELYS